MATQDVFKLFRAQHSEDELNAIEMWLRDNSHAEAEKRFLEQFSQTLNNKGTK